MEGILQPLRAYEHWLAQYKRVWRGTLGTSLVNPLLYLAALGVGLGTIVDQSPNAPAGVPYLDYIAPGLLAAAAMQTAATESSWPVMGAIKWTRTYYAMTATPLTERTCCSATSCSWSRACSPRAPRTWWSSRLSAPSTPGSGLLAIPVAVLIGTAFSMPMAALCGDDRVRLELPADLPLRDRADVPLLGDVLPGLADAARARAARLRDADLARRRALPRADARHDRVAAALGHTAYLLAWTIGGLELARRAYRKRLFK